MLPPAEALGAAVRHEDRRLVSLAWTHDPVWLIVYVLTAYRLTRLWTRDLLPPLPAIRDYVATRYAHKAWSLLFDCPWCAGFHIAWMVALIESSPLATAWHWVAVPLAASAVIGLLSAREE